MADFTEYIRYTRLLGYHLLRKQPMALSIGSIVLRYIHIVELLLVEAYNEESRKRRISRMDSVRDLSLSSIICKSVSQNAMCNAISNKIYLKEVEPGVFVDVDDQGVRAGRHRVRHRERQRQHQRLRQEIHQLRVGMAGRLDGSEIVLTYSQSHAVGAFLRKANSADGSSRNINVMVCETFPSLMGQQFALDLAHSGIKTTLIHDAASFTVMPRCNKVVIGCHAVLANGGILVPSGGYNLVMAASQFKVPVIVVTGMYKVGARGAIDRSCTRSSARTSRRSTTWTRRIESCRTVCATRSCGAWMC